LEHINEGLDKPSPVPGAAAHEGVTSPTVEKEPVAQEHLGIQSAEHKQALYFSFDAQIIEGRDNVLPAPPAAAQTLSISSVV